MIRNRQAVFMNLKWRYWAVKARSPNFFQKRLAPAPCLITFSTVAPCGSYSVPRLVARACVSYKEAQPESALPLMTLIYLPSLATISIGHCNSTPNLTISSLRRLEQ